MLSLTRSVRIGHRSIAQVRSLVTSGSQLGWTDSLTGREPLDATAAASYSKQLSATTCVYEIVSETVSPKRWNDYLKHKAELFEAAKGIPGIRFEHIASWHFIYGDVIFKAMHLIKFKEGHVDVDKTRLALKNNSHWQAESAKGVQLIQQQENELYKGFAHWPEPEARSGNNIYDIRSYELIPGSMGDWANYWAKGIKYRQTVRPDIPYCGLFSNIGGLNKVHHVWCYKDLSDRTDCRGGTWEYPEWNEIVIKTQPLFRRMSSRICEPLPFSPTR